MPLPRETSTMEIQDLEILYPTVCTSEIYFAETMGPNPGGSEHSGGRGYHPPFV